MMTSEIASENNAERRSKSCSQSASSGKVPVHRHVHESQCPRHPLSGYPNPTPWTTISLLSASCICEVDTLCRLFPLRLVHDIEPRSKKSIQQRTYPLTLFPLQRPTFSGTLTSKYSDEMVPKSLELGILDIPADFITIHQLLCSRGPYLKLHSSSMSWTVLLVTDVDPFVSGATILERCDQQGETGQVW